MIHYMTPRGAQDAWVGNELRVVAAAGIPFQLHSLERPEQVYFAAPEIRALETHSLYPVRPLEFLASIALAPGLFGRRFLSALGNALFGPRESVAIRLKGLWHLGLACLWARRVRSQPVSLIHAQWIHSAGTVAMYGAWLLDVPFSFTGHGADLFRDRAALLDKIRRADFIVCISTFHRDYYLEHGARPEQLLLVYCGIDTDHFDLAERRKGPGESFRILASGRLVEKKGFAHLIAACEELCSRGLEFECVIAGSGELEQPLVARIERAGLTDRVRVTGNAIKQEEIPAFMHGGDLYCLPCVRASDGDADGLPQMLMEAMACGLPVVSTRISGIPDLVVDGECGVLVEPGSPAELADAIERLMADPIQAAKLATAGRQRVVDLFDLRTCLTPLLDRFRSKLSAR